MKLKERRAAKASSDVKSAYIFRFFLVVAMLMTAGGCGNSGDSGQPAADATDNARVVVNNLADAGTAAAGSVTLRAALEQVADGGTIVFDPALDGGIIALETVGEEHSVLRGEVFVMTGQGWSFEGYQERDYGASALYARKNLTIDASDLPGGIALHWTGGMDNPARVLSVYGDLTLRNITITGGYSVAQPTDAAGQPYTLARGGGLAVWGRATLTGCTIGGNTAIGDLHPSRDRGAFGGGIYANLLLLEDSVVSGNRVAGFGAAGGGVYAIGGAGYFTGGTTVRRSVLSGNRVEGQHAYGGGIYSDGGGPGNNRMLRLENSTVARNAVADHPDLDEDVRFQYYYRGGGIYMTNGFMALIGCTIAENAVSGPFHAFNGKPNVGGGGVAATIGNAHVVENMWLRHSIVVGNTVNAITEDIFTGSLIHFYSQGYNLVGYIDFSQILVPIPESYSLSRKHWPKAGDRDGILPEDILDTSAAARHPFIDSVGTDPGLKAVLWYPVVGAAVDAIPVQTYRLTHVLAQYSVAAGGEDDFLHHVLQKVRAEYTDVLGADFGLDLDALADATFHGPWVTWPANPDNAPWITFWHALEDEIGDRLGPAGLADGFWERFSSGPLGVNLVLDLIDAIHTARLSPNDQRDRARPQGAFGDIGAIEMDGSE